MTWMSMIMRTRMRNVGLPLLIWFWSAFPPLLCNVVLQVFSCGFIDEWYDEWWMIAISKRMRVCWCVYERRNASMAVIFVFRGLDIVDSFNCSECFSPSCFELHQKKKGSYFLLLNWKLDTCLHLLYGWTTFLRLSAVIITIIMITIITMTWMAMIMITRMRNVGLSLLIWFWSAFPPLLCNVVLQVFSCGFIDTICFVTKDINVKAHGSVFMRV